MIVAALGVLLNAARAGYVVSVVWLTLQVTDDLSSVGLVLLWYNVLSLTAGPYLGEVVDRCNKKRLLIAAETVMALGFGYLIVVSAFGNETALLEIIAVACLLATCSLLSLPSYYALMKVSLGERAGLFTIRLNAAIALASAAMVGITGLAISLGGVEVGFAACACCSFAAVVLACLSPALRTPDEQEGGPARGVLAGFRYVAADHILLLGVVCMAAAFAAAQLTNASLGALVRMELGLDALHYGIADAAWALGGIIGGLLCAQLMRAVSTNLLLPTLCVALLNVSLVLIGSATAWTVVAVAHVVCGLCFGAARSMIDALVIARSNAAVIGRTRNAMQALIGAAGVLVFLAPSVFDASARSMYSVGGMMGTVLAAAIGLQSLRRRISAKSPG